MHFVREIRFACEMPAGVGGFISFHIVTKRRNISQFPQGNYFTFGNAEYFTKNRSSSSPNEKEQKYLFYRPFTKDWVEFVFYRAQPFLVLGKSTDLF